MKYKKYPSYKDSGVEWLGYVPEHWVSIKFKHAFDEKKKKNNLNLDCGSISFGTVVYKDNEKIPEETKAAYQEVLAGEFLINPLNLNFDLKSLRTALSDIDVVVSTGYIVLKSRPNINKNYLRWLLYQFDVAHMKTLGAGVRQTVNFTDIGNSYYYMPAQEEQQQIALFLDTATLMIDTLIEKQERLIELLKEKRQAVISHAVSKGLDPDVKMKDSGFEWLGEIPEHWEISKLKYMAAMNPKKSELSQKFDMECNFVPMEKLKIGTIDLSETKKISEVYDGYTYFRNDDILLAKVTPCFENRNIAIASDLHNSIGFGSTEINVFRSFARTDKEYLYLLLQEEMFVKIATMQMTGAGGLKRVPSEFLLNFSFSLPPLNEQKAIASSLNKKINKMNKLTEKATKAIELLKEKRTALISAAVTGKIDVREAS